MDIGYLFFAAVVIPMGLALGIFLAKELFDVDFIAIVRGKLE